MAGLTGVTGLVVDVNTPTHNTPLHPGEGRPSEPTIEPTIELQQGYTTRHAYPQKAEDTAGARIGRWGWYTKSQKKKWVEILHT